MQPGTSLYVRKPSAIRDIADVCTQLLGNLGKGFLVGLNVQGGAVSAALNVRLDGA